VTRVIAEQRLCQHDHELLHHLLVPKERAGVLVVRSGRLALIERWKNGRHYWVVPGGGVEAGETIAQAAQREAEEELGVPVELGALRVRLDHCKADGSIQRQWYFDASVSTDDIRIVGPEADRMDASIYRAVWVDLAEIDAAAVLPSVVATLVILNEGNWVGPIVEIDER
jgi:8-oxo-dGTP diphosphatase